MSKRAIAKIIYLSGTDGMYCVHTGDLDGLPARMFTDKASTGHAVVATLRGIAAVRWRDR